MPLSLLCVVFLSGNVLRQHHRFSGIISATPPRQITSSTLFSSRLPINIIIISWSFALFDAVKRNRDHFG
jgi:hypothetical protein